ncbi:MAG: 50S ribosomal protein L10 [Candidatus Latescibacteria bacterium]|nr:50S ribosomal protein L10 [Candidatus Latescibacterota bacterium]
MNKKQKEQIVEEFVAIFGKSGVYLMDFKGLNVAEITELRSSLRAANVSMKVVKNTLAKRALESVGIEGLSGYFVGPTGVVWAKSDEDAVTPARILLDFLSKHDKGTIKAGLIEGTVFADDGVVTISKLPTKHELYAKVASALNAPMVKLAQTLNALPVKFVRTVDALRERKSNETN